MKVLLVNHFPLTGSGSGVYTQNIANSLVKLGHEVAVIFPENQKCYHDNNFIEKPVYFTGADAQFAKASNALSFNFPCFTTHPRSLTTFEDLTEVELKMYIDAFRGAIREAVRSFNPDVIHCGHIWILASIAAEFGVPVVITSHGTDLMGIQNSPRFADFATTAAKKSKAIISISKGNFELLEKVLPEYKDKFHLILNGYNPDVFYPDKVSKAQVLRGFGIDERYKKIVSFAGKFAHFKGIDVLLYANSIYDRDDVATILAGDGELFDEMSALKDELGLKNTFFVHNQPHSKLRELYSAADVSVVCSRNEPFGLVAIEAGACAAPVVASKSGGLLDIIDDKTGLFFEQENAHELALRIESILDENVIFDRSEVAKSTFERFSQDIFTKKMVDEIYK